MPTTTPTTLSVKYQKIRTALIDWPSANHLPKLGQGTPDAELLDRLLVALPPVLMKLKNGRYLATNNLYGLAWAFDPLTSSLKPPRALGCFVVEDGLWGAEDWQQLQSFAIPFVLDRHATKRSDSRKRLIANPRLKSLVKPPGKKEMSDFMAKPI